MIKSIIKKIKSRRAPLNTFILMAVLVNTLVALVLTSSFLLTGFNNSSVDTAIQNTEQSTQNIAKVVSSLISEKEEQLSVIKKIISYRDDNLREDTLDTVLDLNPDIVSIVAYSEDGIIISSAYDDKFVLKDNYYEENLSFDMDIYINTKGFYISPPHVNNLFYEQYPWVVTFMIPDFNDFGEVSYVTMDIEFSKISQYIDKILIGDRGYVYVADDDGNIIYHPKQQLIYSSLVSENEEIIPELFSNGTASSDSNIYSVTAVDNSDWNVVGVSSVYEMVSQKNNEFMSYSVIVILVAFLITIMLAKALSSGLTKPFRSLISTMQSFNHNVDTFEPVNLDGFKEVKDISITFNDMAENIKELKSRVVLEEQELRKTELKALQSQINPHFLYNTLDSIFWLCKEKGNKDAAKMVSALSDTFRISISRGHDEISIKEELQHAKSYLLIQNIRYKDQFTYEFEVAEDILEYKCLKIILQPFIENAIYHGLNRMVDDGEIIIRGYKEENDIILEVCDNGIGMDEEQIGNLFLENSDKVGIGVKNVHNRVAIHYGFPYGIEVLSELDEGTTIKIRIPIVKDGDGND